MVKSLATSLIGYPSSVLRYGLLSVKPIRFEEVRKMKGMKFLVKGIRYEPEKSIEKFEDFVGLRIGQILDRMPLPESYSAEKIYDHFVKNSLEQFDEDGELKRELEKRGTSLLGFVKFFKSRYEKEIPLSYSGEADRFLRSNLPLSFFAQTSMFINTYQKYLTIIKEVVGRYESLAGIAGVRDRDRHIGQQLNKMKYVLSPLIDEMDKCAIEINALKTYICIWCADRFEDIDDPRFLDINKLDPAVLDEYKLNYDTEHKNMRKMIYETAASYVPNLLQKEIMPEDSVAVMLSKLLSSDMK